MENFINNAPFALVLVFLVIGFVLLIKGADFFVEGSSSVAKRLHVPSIIIGLTIVAMGTSLPETAVSVSASLAGNNELAVSNVVGSNIFNLMVVIGVCAMIATVEVARETIRRDIPLSLICAGLLLLLGTIGLGDQANMTLGHFDGVIFIGLFAGYIFYMIRIALKANKEGKKVEIEGGSDEEIKLISVPLSIIFIIGGAAAIAFGGDLTVDAASRIASDLGMTQTLIGLTIVAMGTSLPETAVSVSASITGNNELAVSNVVGSNIFNLMVVIGVCAMIATVEVARETIRRDIPLSLICAGLLLLLGSIGLGDPAKMTLGHFDGVIFIGLFAGYIFYMIRIALKANKEGKKVEIEGGSDEEIKLISVPLSIIFIIGGAAAIAFGGDLTVDAASRIASDLGMTQTLIGLTIVSIGTSLPELVTSIVAARKNEVDMALGNAIGSNVFNILMVLGIASAISPISIITENIIDLCVLIAFTVCVWIFAGSKKKIGRVEGFCMVALYAAYAVYIIIR